MRGSTSILLGLLVLAVAAGLVVLLTGDTDPVVADRGATTAPAPSSEAAADLIPAAPSSEGSAETDRVAIGPKAKAPEERPAKPEPRTRGSKELEGPFLFGRVVDTNGIPVADVEVRLRAMGQVGKLFGNSGKHRLSTTQTDARGDFFVERGLFERGELEIDLTARGYLTQREERMPDGPTGDADLGVFTLREGVVLGGVVTDANGQPVEDATVRTDGGGLDGIFLMAANFEGAAAEKVESDEDGRFELVHQEPGPYRLTVEHDAYPTKHFEGEGPLAGQEDHSLVLRFDPTASIAGRIRDFPLGRKRIFVQAFVLAGEDDGVAPMARLFQEAGLASSDRSKVEEDGSFHIHGLELDRRYRIHAFEQKGFSEGQRCTGEVEAPSGAQGVELQWDAGATVTFRVVDARTGSTIPTGEVRYRWEKSRSLSFGPDSRRETYQGGLVRLDELRPEPAPGTLQVAVVADGYQEATLEPVSVAAGARLDLGTVRLEGAPMLAVRVFDVGTGEPLERARAALRYDTGEDEDEDLDTFSVSNSVTMRTGEDGRCQLPFQNSERATLVVWRSGYSRVERELTIHDTKREEIVRLLADGEVEIQVRDTSGRNVQAQVSRMVDGAVEGTKKTNAEGYLLWKGLDVGEHAFQASIPEGPMGFAVTVELDDEAEVPASWETVQVASGARSRLQLVLPSTTTLTGRVHAGGRGVPHAKIRFLRGSEPSSDEHALLLLEEQGGGLGPFLSGGDSVLTDSNGAFEIDVVPVGNHRLRVTRPGDSLAHFFPVELHEGTNDYELGLPDARVEGRVVDSDGRPIPDAQVRLRRVADLGADGDEDLAAFTALFGSGSGSGQRAQSDGTFVLTGVPAETRLAVEAEAPGYATARSEAFEVDFDETERGVRVVLLPAGSLRVDLIEPSAFAMVSAVFAPGGEEESTGEMRMAFAQNGVAILRDLTPGTWTVSLETDGEGESEGHPVEIVAGQEARIEL